MKIYWLENSKCYSCSTNELVSVFFDSIEVNKNANSVALKSEGVLTGHVHMADKFLTVLGELMTEKAA